MSNIPFSIPNTHNIGNQFRAQSYWLIHKRIPIYIHLIMWVVSCESSNYHNKLIQKNTSSPSSPFHGKKKPNVLSLLPNNAHQKPLQLSSMHSLRVITQLLLETSHKSLLNQGKHVQEWPQIYTNFQQCILSSFSINKHKLITHTIKKQGRVLYIIFSTFHLNIVLLIAI